MNLLLHGLEYPQIDSGNSLRFPLREIGDRDRVDVILTNPPFGGEEERGILGNFPEDKQTAETALLFLQLIMRKLRRAPQRRPRRGGRAERHALRRRRLRAHQGGAADGVQPAHHRAAAQRRLCALHQHPHQPALLRPHRPDARTSGTTSCRCPRGASTTPRRSRLQFEEFADCLAWWRDRQENEHAWRVAARDVLKYDAAGVLVSVNLDIKNPNAADRSGAPAAGAVGGEHIAEGAADRGDHGGNQAGIGERCAMKTPWPMVQLGEVLAERQEVPTARRSIGGSRPDCGQNRVR